jgi:hypothetical protein
MKRRSLVRIIPPPSCMDISKKKKKAYTLFQTKHVKCQTTRIKLNKVEIKTLLKITTYPQ